MQISSKNYQKRASWKTGLRGDITKEKHSPWKPISRVREHHLPYGITGKLALP